MRGVSHPRQPLRATASARPGRSAGVHSAPPAPRPMTWIPPPVTIAYRRLAPLPAPPSLLQSHKPFQPRLSARQRPLEKLSNAAAPGTFFSHPPPPCASLPRRLFLSPCLCASVVNSFPVDMPQVAAYSPVALPQEAP